MNYATIKILQKALAKIALGVGVELSTILITNKITEVVAKVKKEKAGKDELVTGVILVGDDQYELVKVERE